MAEWHDALRELRADLKEYMGERFDAIDNRLNHINGNVRDHDVRIAVIEATNRPDAPPQPPPGMLRDKRTWQVSGIGAALATIALTVAEFIKAWAAGR